MRRKTNIRGWLCRGWIVSLLLLVPVFAGAGEWHYSGLSGGKTTMDYDYQLFSEPVVRAMSGTTESLDAAAQGPMRGPVNGGGQGQPDPNTQLPIGDGVVPLLLMLAVYAGWKGGIRLRR